MSGAAADLVIRSRRVVLPDGVREAAVVVRDGRIAAVVPAADAPDAPERVDAGDLWVMPGLIDTHVHVNEPGRTEWEGFASATRAAAAAGITTIVDMPLNSTPATTTVAALDAKRGAAAGACRVDVGFWGGVVPGNASELPALAEAGVLGFKCFMVPSGVDDFAEVGASDLRIAMPILARLGLPLLVHAESPGPIAAAAAQAGAGADPRHYATWLASRPPAAEVEAIRLLLALCADTGCAVHIVHLAAAEALPDLVAARARKLPVTVETCPHYVTFIAEEIADRATTFKCAPPIRARANRERLWQALGEGAIDLIASDHSPCPPSLKRQDTGDFLSAWGGIASLELGPGVVWTEAGARGFTPADLVRWMSAAPARLAGLGGRKGAIVPGADADFVVWDADAEWVVRGQALQHRHPLTPYEGRTLRGIARSTFVRGRCVYRREGSAPGHFPGEAAGRLLLDRARVSG